MIAAEEPASGAGRAAALTGNVAVGASQATKRSPVSLPFCCDSPGSARGPPSRTQIEISSDPRLRHKSRFMVRATLLIRVHGGLFISDFTPINHFQVPDPAGRANGMITSVAYDGAYGFSGDGGLATQTMLWGPICAAVGRDRRLIVDDSHN